MSFIIIIYLCVAVGIAAFASPFLQNIEGEGNKIMILAGVIAFLWGFILLGAALIWLYKSIVVLRDRIKAGKVK